MPVNLASLRQASAPASGRSGTASRGSAPPSRVGVGALRQLAHQRSTVSEGKPGSASQGFVPAAAQGFVAVPATSVSPSQPRQASHGSRPRAVSPIQSPVRAKAGWKPADTSPPPQGFSPSQDYAVEVARAEASAATSPPTQAKHGQGRGTGHEAKEADDGQGHPHHSEHLRRRGHLTGSPQSPCVPSLEPALGWRFVEKRHVTRSAQPH